MGKIAKHRHLRRRGNRWWVRVAVPRALRHLYTSPHVERPLRTENVAEAEHHKLPIVHAIHAEFRQKLREPAVAQPQDVDEADKYRKELARAQDMGEDAEDGDNVTQAEIIEGLISDEAERIEKAHGIERAKRFAGLAYLGNKKTLREAWADWMLSCDFTAGTKAKYGWAFRDLMAFLAVPDEVPSAITHEHALAFVDWLNAKATTAQGRPLDPATKQARALTLSSFWRHMERIRLIPKGSNPWRDHVFTGAREKARKKAPERDFTREEMLALANSPEQGDMYTKRMMLQLYALGFYTGARFEELCARRIGDFKKIKGGYLMEIRDAKTRAGVRDLPILHPIPVAVIRECIGKRKDPEAFLFDKLTPGGPDKKRSYYIGKSMQRQRHALGFPKGVNFHSTRHSFSTRMEERAVDSRWAERYFGHSVAGLMGKRYSHAKVMREVAQAIRYPAKVEEAFRKALGIK